MAQILADNLNNPAHYGNNQPGLFSSDGKPIFLNSRFTYWDLVQYGASGDDGFEGFLRDANLPSDTAYETILIAAGLLLVDWIVEELDNNRESFANFLCGHAHQLAEEVLIVGLSKGTPEQIEEAVKKKLSEAGRHAAQAKLAADPKQKDKATVRECWDDWKKEPDRYKTKAAFARDMREKFPNLESQPVIEGWCRVWERET